MRRCIYADSLLTKIKAYRPYMYLGEDALSYSIKMVELEPTADVRENEHACWILDPDGMDWGLPAWKCSRCGCVNNNIGVVEDTGGLEQNPFLWAGSKYCPNCGAQMRQKTANPMGSIKVPKMPTATQPINGEPTISPLGADLRGEHDG